MDNSPQELLRKAAISGTSLPNVILNRQQTERFLDDVVNESTLLQLVRNVRRDHPSGEINRLYFGEPVSEDAGLAAQTRTPSEAVVNYDSTKLRCAFDLKTDFIEDIRAQSPEEARKSIMELFAKQIANDIEQLGIEGDDSTSGTADADDRLERTNDGYLVLMDTDLPAAQDLDAAGAAVSHKLFRDILNNMPSKFKKNKNELLWLVSPQVETDWIYAMAQGSTALGAASVEGYVPKPFGIAMQSIPLWPEDLTYGTSVTDATQIVLVNPKNFVYFVQREVTWEWDRAPRSDQWEVTIHARVDFAIENENAVSRAKNISLSGTAYS